MAYEPIITNKAKEKMLQWQMTNEELMAAFNSSMTESTGHSTVGIYRMNGYEVCAMYVRDPKGQWVIISCWKR